MIAALPWLLRSAGAGLILLALLHIPIGRHLRWAENAARLTPANAAIFHVHNFFICVVLVMMGLPCVLDPLAFLERTRASGWLTWSFAVFWALRLYCQWLVYPATLWRGKRMETAFHYWFTLVWLALAALFTLCGLVQMGRVT
jgi:hypothetical protein